MARATGSSSAARRDNGTSTVRRLADRDGDADPRGAGATRPKLQKLQKSPGPGPVAIGLRHFSQFSQFQRGGRARSRDEGPSHAGRGSPVLGSISPLGGRPGRAGVSPLPGRPDVMGRAGRHPRCTGGARAWPAACRRHRGHLAGQRLAVSRYSNSACRVRLIRDARWWTRRQRVPARTRS
jgi:hypothetical protein